MKELVYIFIGSGLGGVARYGLGRWINSFHATPFPWGTLAVNILACLILGFVVGLADNRHLISATTRLFWMVGFCGGFSTFSAFSYETLSLFQSGNHLTNFLYIAASIVICFGATFIGLTLANRV